MGKLKKYYSRHKFTQWVSNNSFADGEYWTCERCGAIKFPNERYYGPKCPKS